MKNISSSITHQNSDWHQIITTYPFLNITTVLDSPYKQIMNELTSMPNWKKVFNTPRNPYERQLINSVNLGESVGGHGFVPASGWKIFSVFNGTGKSNHTIIHNFSPDLDKSGYLNSYKQIKKHRWTEVRKYFPYLEKWISEKIEPYFYVAFIRFMILEPGGIIPPHNDIPQEIRNKAEKEATSYNILNSIHISLYQKPGNIFCVDNKFIPFKPGTVFWINVGREHWTINMSSDIRIHLQIQGLYKKAYRDYIIKNISNIEKSTFENSYFKH